MAECDVTPLMQKLYVLSIFLVPLISVAQSDSISGSYVLANVREMASVIQLNGDSTFGFYFSYGALDRWGSGRWRTRNSEVILDSKPAPGPIFKLIDSSIIRRPGVSLSFKDTNPVYFNFIYAQPLTTPTGDMVKTTSAGSLFYPVKTQLKLQLELAPEKEFLLPFTKYNQYTLAVQPWALEVFFNSFTLQISPGKLTGKHPLLEKDSYEYERQ